MKLRKNALIAVGLAFSMLVQTPMAAFATEIQAEEVSTEAAENVAENTVMAAETAQVDETQLSPWLITEVVTDTCGSEKYTYVEIYNNSDQVMDLADYVLYYSYPTGGGYAFSKKGAVPGLSENTSTKYNQPFCTADSSTVLETIPVDSGESLIIWFNNNLKTTTLTEFKTWYGLGDDVNIIRANHSGISQTAERGYHIGKDLDSILIEAYVSADDVSGSSKNETKQACQLTFPRTGIECEKTGMETATPGTVTADQVPSTRVTVEETPISISNVTATGDGDFVVTAEIPYEGTAGAMAVNLTYNQSAGTGEDAITSEDITIAMTPVGDRKTFTATVPKSEVWGTSATYSIKASYGGTNKQTTEQATIELNRRVASAENGAPLIITELASTSPDNNYDFFELYNQSDKTINLGAWTIYICYDYPNKTSAQSGNNMKFVDFTATIAPGETKVCWVNQKDLTVDDFNAYYGTNLTEENIVEVDYNGMHASSPRWFKIGYTEADAFTVAGFNEEAWQIPEATYALQYAAPNDDTGVNKSIPVKVDVATPGNLASWQVTDTEVHFNGYPGYQPDDGQAPTLAVCDVMEKPVPESITEGEDLQVIYDVDLLASAVGESRLEAFSGEYHGGSEALKNRPRLLGTEIYYKLDNETEWTVVQEKKQHSIGHYLMQLTSDMLYGHDQVTFKVRAYTLYGYSETEETTVKINRLNDTNGEVRLNVTDGALVSGDITVTANDGKNNADTQIMVDGAAQPLKRTFENGAYFFIKASGLDTYFKNAVTAPYGENEREILAFLVAWRQLPQSRAIRVDNKYFTYNAETDTYDTTVTVWAGSAGTPFEEIYDIVANENHEDFTVSGLQMKLINGNSYLPTLITPENEKTNNSTALDAVHQVGDSTGMSPSMGASFSIPAGDAEAVGTTVNTKDLEDGTHTITATAGEKTTEATIIVDNKKPEINLGIEDGATVDDTIYVDILNVTDENGINDVMISLDDALVEYPATIIPRELSAGEHTLTVAATDMAGNAETKTITFITEEVDPTIGNAGNGVIEYETAELSVSLDSEADVAFYEGRTLTVENAGITAGEVVEPGNGEAPYQVLSLNTGDVAADTELALSWNGAASNVDETHPLMMFALNVNTNAWTSIGQADANGNINVEFPAGDYVADGKAVLLVQCITKGTQPKVLPAEAEELVEENETLEVMEMTDWDGTNRPEDYDFAFAWETDTQYYTESFPYHYTNMNQWIVDHADDWKIRYVFHTGDIVDDCDMLGEWKVADEAMQIFDDAGMPYGVLGGNHDVYAGAEGYGSYWQYFGEERFADKDYYGGSYVNNKGHYDLLTENGEDFVIIYMSWDIYEEELNWMNEVLQQYSDRKAILAFHRYINASGNIDYTGKLIQDQVVAKNPNVFMVIDGHYHGASYNIVSFDDNGDDVDDRTVYQVCTDYQTDPEGGSEYIKFMYFDLENNKVYLNSYSPYRQDFNFYNTAKQSHYVAGDVKASIDIAELDVDFGGAESYNKTLSTNNVSVDVRTTNVIGTVENVSGTAAYTWEGLTPGTIYSWYAKVTNDRNGVTITPVQSFTTMTVVEAEKYEITATAGEGGTISNPGTIEVEEGASITYTFAPEDGYKVSKVLVDGYEEELADGTYTFENVTDNHTIEVIFEKIVIEETEVARIFGKDRYETSYKVADVLRDELGIEKFEAVVVATGKNFADALAGSYLAVEKKAPILLTNGKDANIEELHTYIKANVAEGGKVYILGGEAAVPAAVEAIDGYDVVRLYGDSRYDTNLAILNEAGVTGDSIIVATGKTFADSLSASAAKLPILLVKPNAALNDTQKEILAGMKNIYIVGGEGAVSDAYAEELAAYGEVTRVYGNSRYDTSVEIARTFCTDADKAVVASGKNFPDGLCGGPLAAALNAPLVLTKDGGTDAAAGYIAENTIATGFVLGGEGALTDKTVVDVFGLKSAEEML